MFLEDPIILIKNALEYCRHNTKYLLVILTLIILSRIVTDYFARSIILLTISMNIILLFMFGYGMMITREIINGGEGLPRFNFKDAVTLGIKGILIQILYIFIQFLLTTNISRLLTFHNFELEELLVNFQHTIVELYSHDPINVALFIIIGLIITYVFMFFMEIALAMAADGEKFIDSFNVLKIKDKIDLIGWKHYTLEYTVVILTIAILTIINEQILGLPIIEEFIWFLIFIIEFTGIGEIYKKTKA